MKFPAKIAGAAIVAAVACTACATTSGATSEPNEVNWTEADFAQDFAMLTYYEQQDVCDWFYSSSEAEFSQQMWDDGYVETQIINAWNVLVEVCS